MSDKCAAAALGTPSAKRAGFAEARPSSTIWRVVGVAEIGAAVGAAEQGGPVGEVGVVRQAGCAAGEARRGERVLDVAAHAANPAGVQQRQHVGVGDVAGGEGVAGVQSGGEGVEADRAGQDQTDAGEADFLPRRLSDGFESAGRGKDDAGVRAAEAERGC